MQISTFLSDDSAMPQTNRCVDLLITAHGQGQKTTLIPRPCTCERCGTTRGRECRTGDSEFRCSVANTRSSRDVVAVAGIPGEACEYGHDNHYATPSPESHMSRAPCLTNIHYRNTGTIVPSKLGVSTMAWPNPGTLPIVAAGYNAASLLNGKDKSYKNDDLIADGNSTAHLRDNGHYQQSGFQLWKCLKTTCECVCLFEKMLLLVLIVSAREVKGDFDNECVDSGGSSLSPNQGSGGGGSSSSGSGSGKKQQNTNSNRSGSSSSSSQRSGSGSSQRGGGGMGMGGGRTLSGSSGDSSDDGDDDHNKRPHQQLNKEPKSKPDFDDEDDEETDSADEGADDGSPRDMTLDTSSPQSAHNDNGGSMSSHGVGLGGVGEGGGGEGKSQEGRKGRNNIGNLPLLGSGGSGTNSDRFSTTSMSGGATVESITLKEGMAGSSRITTTTFISSSQIDSPVNMAVGYGVPVLAATDGDGLITTTAAVGAASSSSVPSSELGTPTQDSPSPPSHLGGRVTPGTPQPMSPETTANPQVRQFS